MSAQPESYAIASGEVLSGGRFRFADDKIVAAGDSLTDIDWTGNGGGFQWGMAIARCPMLVSYNAGVAGNTIGQLVTRWPTSVENKNPAAVLTRIGTNNLSSSSVPNESYFRTQYQPIIDWHVDNRVPGVIHAVPPELNTPASAILSQNAWLAAQCAAHPGLLYFANDSVDLGDAEYNYLSTYSSDGTHMNGYGKRKQGERMAPVLRALFGTKESRLLNGADTYEQNTASNQLVRNPLGAGSGPIPDNWSVVASGSNTFSAESVAAEEGDPVQVPWLRVTPLTAVNNDTFRVSAGLAHPAYASTLASLKRLDMTAEIRFNSLDASKFRALECGVYWFTNGTYPCRKLYLHMGYPQTLNETIIARAGLQRDQGGYTLYSLGANTLRADIIISTALSGFTESPGSFDVRCVSVRGRQE